MRALSLKEYALIQEFPEDWELCGSVSQQYAQVGNAVPVRLGEVAGEVIVKRMDHLARANWEPETGDHERYRIIYVQSHVRTRQWFKDGETFVWQEGDESGQANYGKPKTMRKISVID